MILIADCMYSSLARKVSTPVNEDQSFYLCTQSFCVIGNYIIHVSEVRVRLLSHEKENNEQA